MNLLLGHFRSGVRTGTPVAISDVTITPRSVSIVIEFSHAVWAWNLPVGIEVERNGIAERIPIVDSTRWILLSLTALALLSGSLGLRRTLRKGVDS
jgi:hypothetical protein